MKQPEIRPAFAPPDADDSCAPAVQAAPTPAPTLIVILGMHRSGTSVITRAMETMGAQFGSRLKPAVAGVNDKGFFEDVDISDLNEDIMHAVGSDWHAMAPPDLAAMNAQHLEELRTKATFLLRAKSRDKIFALKDPRIVRLLPFWQPIFAELPSRVLYVIAVRNPISVAHSLTKRDGFAEVKSYILWLAHTVCALDMMGKSQACTLISYDALLNTPRAELLRISQHMGLPLIEPKLDAFEQEFLDDGLRHTRFTPHDLDVTPAAPRQVKALFTALDETIRGDLANDNAMLTRAIEDARAYLKDIEPLLLYEWPLSAQLDAMQKELTGARQELANVHQLLAAVRASLSWRITLPLRVCKRLFFGRA